MIDPDFMQKCAEGLQGSCLEKLREIIVIQMLDPAYVPHGDFVRVVFEHVCDDVFKPVLHVFGLGVVQIDVVEILKAVTQDAQDIPGQGAYSLVIAAREARASADFLIKQRPENPAEFIEGRLL